MTAPFIILANPRSRTAWLSRFLSYGGWECGHEQLRYARTLDDVKNWLSMPGWGTAETTAAPFWRLIQKYAPDTRVVTIRRPMEEILLSLEALGVKNLGAMAQNLEAGDRKLDQLEGRLRNVKRVEYRDLDDESVCAEIFEFCLGLPYDARWWQTHAQINIQINFGALVRYAIANQAGIQKLRAMAKQMIYKDLSLRKMDLSSVKITEESPEVWERDCQHLFSQHCVDVDEHPNNWRNKNWPLFKKLHENGFMQIMVARSNGKAFGYLMTLLSPSLEGERMLAQHTTFFASESIPGLGRRLQRAAMKRLEEKNVKEIILRSGVRGDGERLEMLYKRLGAAPLGKMFRLELGV